MEKQAIKTMEAILKTTKYTEKGYQLLKIESLAYWADKHALSHTHLQKIISNRLIINWFMSEYSDLENEYLNLVSRLPEATDLDNKRLYARVMSKIYKLYPKALLDKVNKPKSTIQMLHSLN